MNDIPSLSGWTDICDSSQSYPDSPSGGGTWCLGKNAGNYQGCFPGYVYQKVTEIHDGETWQLTGWARRYNPYSPSPSIFFAKTDSTGILSLLEGDTLDSDSWSVVTVQHTFSLLPGDTALALLNAGNCSGPAMGTSLFDLISITEVTGISNKPDNTELSIYPVPCNDFLIIYTKEYSQQFEVEIRDISGKQVLKKYDSGSQCNEQKIATGFLLRGIYFVVVKSGTSQIVLKLIKI